MCERRKKAAESCQFLLWSNPYYWIHISYEAAVGDVLAAQSVVCVKVCWFFCSWRGEKSPTSRQTCGMSDILKKVEKKKIQTRRRSRRREEGFYGLVWKCSVLKEEKNVLVRIVWRNSCQNEIRKIDGRSHQRKKVRKCFFFCHFNEGLHFSFLCMKESFFRYFLTKEKSSNALLAAYLRK